MKGQDRGGDRAAPKIITLALAGLLALTATAATVIFTADKAEELGGISGVYDGAGNELTSDGLFEMPANMVFAVPTSESETANAGITVTATIKPDTASNKAIDWEVDFENAESDWARGKAVEEYAKVTPESDGSATATVECLQAFGEPINLTARSRKYPDVTAVCKLDYMSKVESAELVVRSGDEIAETLDISASGKEYVFSVENIVWGVGTMQEENVQTNISISYHTDYYNWVKEHTEIGSLDMIPAASNTVTATNEPLTFVSSKTNMYHLYGVKSAGRAEFDKGYAGYSGAVVRVTATITNGSDGTAPDYVSYWGTMLELTLGTVDLDIPVTEIELNPPQIIF